MNSALLVIGAGGHASVLADALLEQGATVLGFTDVDARRHGLCLCGLPVLGTDEVVLAGLSPEQVLLVNGIGGVKGCTLRQRVQQRLEQRGWRFSGVQHRTAVASTHARINPTAQLLARSVVQAGAQLGPGCIVNTGAIVEHDCQLDACVHVAPGAVVCGDVHLGERSHVGAGAVVRQGVRLGADSIVGAGAVVTRDFQGGGTLIGVPARQMQ